MNEAEAIEILKGRLSGYQQDYEQFKSMGWTDDMDTAEAEINLMNVLISTLEKQIPKKIEVTKNFFNICPVCGLSVKDFYCSNCGQKLDWSETK